MSYYNKPPISGSGTARATGVRYTDGDGREYLYAYCAAAATKATPYQMSFGAYGVQNQALAAAATDTYIMVAAETASTGEYAKFWTRGEVDVTTASDAIAAAGYMFKVHTDGTVICTDATWDDEAVNEFAVGTQIEATATTHTMFLIGKPITWT